MKKTFKCLNSQKNTAKGNSVPWCRDALKLMRKKTNVLRRRYQWRLHNEELR